MDFRHLIVTCLFSKLRLPFDNQKVKENYAIFLGKLALKKRVYEAGDWNGFRNAVNAHKSFGDYIVIKR